MATIPEFPLTSLPDEHLKAIAHVSIQAAWLDHYIELAFAYSLGDQASLAKQILKTTSTDRVVDAYAAALKDQFPQNQEDVDAYAARVKDARSSRNEILHRIHIATDDGNFATYTHRVFRPEQTDPVTAEQIFKTSDNIARVVADTKRIIDTLAAQAKRRVQSMPQTKLAQILQQTNLAWPLNPSQQGLQLGLLNPQLSRGDPEKKS